MCLKIRMLIRILIFKHILIFVAPYIIVWIY